MLPLAASASAPRARSANSHFTQWAERHSQTTCCFRLAAPPPPSPPPRSSLSTTPDSRPPTASPQPTPPPPTSLSRATVSSPQSPTHSRGSMLEDHFAPLPHRRQRLSTPPASSPTGSRMPPP